MTNETTSTTQSTTSITPEDLQRAADLMKNYMEPESFESYEAWIAKSLLPNWSGRL